MRKLKIQNRHEKASSTKGKSKVEEILNAARDLLIEEGYASLSMRKIAARCKMTVGNLSYYYSSKTDLLSDLTTAVLQEYSGWWDDVMADESLTHEEQFVAILSFIMKDLTTPETTSFFPELWTLANHETFAIDAVDYIYQQEHDMLVEMVSRLNPALDSEDRKILAVHLIATMEGHTVFIGHRKKWNHYATLASNITIHSLLHLVLTITKEDIHSIKKV